MTIGIHLDKAAVAFLHGVPRTVKGAIVGRLGEQPISRVPVLTDISLAIGAGERVGLLGRNGAGKTTLLKLVAGIFPPLSGTRRVDGHIAAVIANGLGLDSALSLSLNVRLGLAYQNRAADYSPALEKTVLEFAELTDQRDRPYGELSAGTRARLSFALSLHQDADILLLDEVFATGDAGFTRKSEAALRDRIDRTPIVVMASHSPDNIRAVCTRAIVLDAGRIVFDGTPDDALERYEELCRA